ncbi:MAG: DUF2911 domain-containing protein [Chitinophagales bacterium]|nr:DUF2911 domain-containing protein [Chitinophagales bacterium]MDW8272654.1 DUF2911 domain-containing protein [Chitinophagales bacterium]
MIKQQFFLLHVAIISFYVSFGQSLPIPPPSPLQTVRQQFATSFIELNYSRPGVKGRVIFGDLVPYGKIWRTGANAATTIEFGEEVTIEQTKVEKGKYGLLTIPGENEWQIIITKDLNVTSANDYKIENDVVRIPVKPIRLCEPVETFTIDIQNIKPTQAEIQLKWDRTMVSFIVYAQIDEKIMKAIDKELATDKRPFYQAANYYYENNKDLSKALEWCTKAAEINPSAYWITHLRAKILYKMKDYANALQSAEVSLQKARDAKNEEYVRMNQKLIAEIKAIPEANPSPQKGKKR